VGFHRGVDTACRAFTASSNNPTLAVLLDASIQAVLIAGSKAVKSDIAMNAALP